VSTVLSNRHQKIFFCVGCLKQSPSKTAYNCTSLSLDPHLLSLDQSAARTRIVCFLLPLAPIHTTHASIFIFLSLHTSTPHFPCLSSLSLMFLGRWVGQGTDVARATVAQGDALLRPPHRELPRSGCDNKVDGGLRRVEISLRWWACRLAIQILLLDLRWRGSSSSTAVARVLLAYGGVDARCL
jgi:hypothetical protein